MLEAVWYPDSDDGKRVASPTLQGTQMDRCIDSNLGRACQRGNWVGLALTGVYTATIVLSRPR